MKGVTGTLFGLAIISYLCRLYIQLYVFKRFPTEDWVLLFAVIVLIGTTILFYVTLPNLYNALRVVLEGAGSSLLLKVLEEIPTESREANAMSTLWWFVLFPVKIAYLIFFKKLISRLKHLTRYWWFVLAFMVFKYEYIIMQFEAYRLQIPALIICEVVSWQTCPYRSTGDLISKCAGPASSTRTVRVTATTTVFDVLSDIFIASIPIALLWRVRISLRQKIGLGITLCLSLVMAIVAVVRISGIRLETGDADIVWVTFWQQNECNVAVAMISLTAFRSFFVRDSDTARDAHPFLWSMLSIKSIKSTLRKRFNGLFRRGGSSYGSGGAGSGSQVVQTDIQSGGGSGIGSNPGNGIGSNAGSGSGSGGSARSNQPMLLGKKKEVRQIKEVKEVNIPRGRMTGIWSQMGLSAVRTRDNSPGATMV